MPTVFTRPTAWDDLGMDWNNLEFKPLAPYFWALLEAYTERFRSYYTSDPAYYKPFTRIENLILYLEYMYASSSYITMFDCIDDKAFYWMNSEKTGTIEGVSDYFCNVIKGWTLNDALEAVGLEEFISIFASKSNRNRLQRISTDYLHQNYKLLNLVDKISLITNHGTTEDCPFYNHCPIKFYRRYAGSDWCSSWSIAISTCLTNLNSASWSSGSFNSSNGVSAAVASASQYFVAINQIKCSVDNYNTSYDPNSLYKRNFAVDIYGNTHLNQFPGSFQAIGNCTYSNGINKLASIEEGNLWGQDLCIWPSESEILSLPAPGIGKSYYTTIKNFNAILTPNFNFKEE